MGNGGSDRTSPWLVWIAVGVGAVVLGPLTPIAAIAWAIVYLVRHPDAATRASFLKRAGFIVVVGPAAFFALFVAGEALSEPGGWTGLALVAGWALPAAILAVVGWRWPDRALIVFAALTAAVLALELWYASNPDGWRAFEDEHGPISTIVTFVVVATMAFLAWRRPKVGGALMLAVPLASMALATFVHELGPAAIAAGAAGVVPGVLFLLSAYYSRRAGPARPTTGQEDADIQPTAA